MRLSAPTAGLLALVMVAAVPAVALTDGLVVPGHTERVSTAWSGGDTDSWSRNARVSANARLVAFSSAASNIVAGDTNNAPDVFVSDRATGAMVRASLGDDGAQCDGAYDPALTADGSHVAFLLLASSCTAWHDAVVLRDLSNGDTTVVSVDADGAHLGPRFGPSVSATGDRVAFMADAPGDHRTAAWVWDASTGAAQVAVTDASGEAVDVSALDMSRNGALLAISTAAALVPGDDNGGQDAYVVELATGAVHLVDTAGESGTGNVLWPAFSPDGAHLLWASPGGVLKVVHWPTGETDTLPGAQGRGVPVASHGARYVAFASPGAIQSPGLSVETDGPALPGVYVWDRDMGAVRLASVDDDGVPRNFPLEETPYPLPDVQRRAHGPAMSDDGRVVAFTTGAPLEAGDENGASDVYTRVAPAGGW